MAELFESLIQASFPREIVGEKNIVEEENRVEMDQLEIKLVAICTSARIHQLHPLTQLFSYFPPQLRSFPLDKTILTELFESLGVTVTESATSSYETPIERYRLIFFFTVMRRIMTYNYLLIFRADSKQSTSFSAIDETLKVNLILFFLLSSYFLSYSFLLEVLTLNILSF